MFVKVIRIFVKTKLTPKKFLGENEWPLRLEFWISGGPSGDAEKSIKGSSPSCCSPSLSSNLIGDSPAEEEEVTAGASFLSSSIGEIGQAPVLPPSPSLDDFPAVRPCFWGGFDDDATSPIPSYPRLQPDTYELLAAFAAAKEAAAAAAAAAAEETFSGEEVESEPNRTCSSSRLSVCFTAVLLLLPLPSLVPLLDFWISAGWSGMVTGCLWIKCPE